MSFRPPGPVLVLIAVVAMLAFVPSSFSAADSGALATALDYLDENASDFGVTSADVSDLFVTSQYTSEHNGVTHVNLNQRFQGLEVFGGHATVNLDRNGNVAFAGGALVGNLAAGASGSADLSATAAVAAAADALDLEDPSGLRVLEGGPASAAVVVSDGGISDAAIPAKLGWQPTKNGLRLAWQLVIDDSSDVHLFNAAVDAKTGALLDVDDWTIEDEYEDLASTLQRTSSASNPSPPAGSGPFAPPVRAVDGSSYRIYEIPREGPNDGPRTVVENPADIRVSPFGWHDTDGIAGAEFTITRGNNVHAYLDQDTNNAADFGGNPDGGAGLDFDFPVDLNEHSQAYRDAVTTNLFYGCNIVHDITTLYGFNEPADNFQQINYSGVGSNGDYVRCEAADGSGTNNANFSTPSAGGTPRMQMYLWPGNQLGSQNQVSVTGGASYGAGWARFGPPAPFVAIAGEYFNSAANGCVAADYTGAPVSGNWIAIAVGGTTGCQPIDKTRTAEAAGAKALVLTSGTSDTTVIASPSGGMAVASPAIPVVNISTANGTALRAALPASGTVGKNPSHPGIRDGDFDFAIIGHEYGHGVSNRLTGGPGINCLSGNEQAGEGWSDYIGLTIPLDPALDDPDQPRGLVPYVLFQPDRHGNGLRPRPYTRDMTIQPFTYDSIKTNGWLANTSGNPTSLALPHGLGHGWNSVLWDMNWDLIDKHGFYANWYDGWDKGGNTRAFQYVMDGMKLQGCGPGLVVARAAIISAANILGGGVAGEVKGDACTVWGSFARRGLGFSAVQGTTNRDDNTEAFDTHPSCRQGFSAGAPLAYGQLNDADPGSTVQLKFSVGGNQGLDILQDHSPFSRKVDCTTLQVPSITPGIVTPREYPTDAVGDLKYRKVGDSYTFNWQTDSSWLGTCREFVLAREGDGIQHRAFFKFVYPFEGFSGTFQSPPALNNTDSRNLQTFWWKMGGDRGLAIFSSDPATRQIDCASKAPLDAYETATGTLAYQASTGRYSYAWQPPAGNAYKGTCREFTISLNDGTSHSVYLNFTR